MGLSEGEMEKYGVRSGNLYGFSWSIFKVIATDLTPRARYRVKFVESVAFALDGRSGKKPGTSLVPCVIGDDFIDVDHLCDTLEDAFATVERIVFERQLHLQRMADGYRSEFKSVKERVLKPEVTA